jgi:hypothetical protein
MKHQSWARGDCVFFYPRTKKTQSVRAESRTLPSWVHPSTPLGVTVVVFSFALGARITTHFLTSHHLRSNHVPHFLPFTTYHLRFTFALHDSRFTVYHHRFIPDPFHGSRLSVLSSEFGVLSCSVCLLPSPYSLLPTPYCPLQFLPRLLHFLGDQLRAPSISMGAF